MRQDFASSEAVESATRGETLKLLVCPVCHENLAQEADEIVCTGCHRRYPWVSGIPVLLPSLGKI